MTERDVIIDGVAFMSLYHHDGRFVRGGGLFAFARRDLDGGRTILHFELTESISQSAGPGHLRWVWAVSQGMNELLVHMAGSQQRHGEIVGDADAEMLRWSLHPDDVDAADALEGDNRSDEPLHAAV